MALSILPLSSELHDEDRLEETYRPFIEELEKEMKEPLRICRGAESPLIRCLLENRGETVPVRYQ